jgi:hypothetical protein
MTGVGLAALIAGGALLLVHVDVRTQPAASAPNATHIVLAKQAGGLPQGEMPPDVAAERDRVAKGGIKVQAAVYLHPKHLDAKPGGPEVIFFGVDGRNDPQATMKEFFDSIATQAPALHGVNNYDPGPLGGLLRCVSVATGGTTEIHCLWADAYTAGHLIAGELTEPETAALFLRMRPDLEKPS